MAKHGVLGINFDHMHMGDLLRAGRRASRRRDRRHLRSRPRPHGSRRSPTSRFPPDRVFTDLEACLTETKADLAIVCSATAEHANYVEKIAPHGLNVMVEKPFAASVADARRMITAMEGTGRRLAINWPLAWYPSHNTAKRLIDEGAIGELIEVHFYDGNRGPLYHLADKVEVSPEEVEKQKPNSWWYKKVGRRRQPARLSRLRRHARHLVHERRGAARGDLRRRRDAGHRGRPALDHRLPLREAGCRSSRRAGARSPTRGRSSRSRNAASCWSGRTARSRATTTTTRHPADADEAPAQTQGAGRRRCRRAGARRSNTCSRASTTARRSPARSTPRSASSASGSSTAPCSPPQTKRTVALVA